MTKNFNKEGNNAFYFAVNVKTDGLPFVFL